MKAFLTLASLQLIAAVPHGPSGGSTAKESAKPAAQPASAAAASAVAEAPAAPKAQTVAPEGCKLLPTDTKWPVKGEWSQKIPSVVGRGVVKDKLKHPDYRIDAKTSEDVVKAVRFAADNNIRLSVLNSGHDFLGRNDAPSGLTIAVGALKGIRLLQKFTPTKEGVPAVNSSTTTPKLTFAPGEQAHVTFGSGVSTQELNDAIAPSNLFTMGAAHAEVSVAGGWGLGGGHSPFAPRFGLGVDQFVEFKVVTADGQLKVANEVENPDLFWALRGGGGGTFGVVTEATVKAHPSPKIMFSIFYVNTTDPYDDKSIFPPLAYLHSTFPDLVEGGFSGFYYMFRNAVKGFFLTINDNGGIPANKILDPIVQNMAQYPGIRKETTISVHFPLANYKEFFDGAFGERKEEKMIHKMRVAMREAGLSDREHEVNEHIRMFRRDTVGRLARRHGPGSGEMESDMTQALGVEPLDSILLEREHLASPKLAEAIRTSMPVGTRGQLRGNLVGGGAVHKVGIRDTSVNPAWRRAYSHIIASAEGGDSIWPNTASLKALGPDSGVYFNEAAVNQTNWKQAFFGVNYERLSEVKTKYDPNGVFWVTPGVNADHFEVQDGRVCRVSESRRARYVQQPPKTDNPNFAKGMALNADGPGFVFWSTPYGWTISPVSAWKGAMGAAGGKIRKLLRS